MSKRRSIIAFLPIAALPILYYNLARGYSEILNLPIQLSLIGLVMVYLWWRAKG